MNDTNTTTKRLINTELLEVTGMKWFDYVNGNTYSSVRVYADGELVAVGELEYGYGDFYRQMARDELETAGFLDGANVYYPNSDLRRPLWQVCDDAGVKLRCTVTEGRKRETVQWGTDPRGER